MKCELAMCWCVAAVSYNALTAPCMDRFSAWFKRTFRKFKARTTPYIDEEGDGLDVYARNTGNVERLTADGFVAEDGNILTGEKVAASISAMDRSRANRLRSLKAHKRDPKSVQEERRAIKAKNRAQAELHELERQSELRVQSLGTRLDGQLLLEDLVFSCALMADNRKTDFFR